MPAFLAALAMSAAWGAATEARTDEVGPGHAGAHREWGAGWNVGRGWLVAGVASGSPGEALAGAFPWEALAKCAVGKPAAAGKDADPIKAVYRVTVTPGVGDANVVTVAAPARGGLSTPCLVRAFSTPRLRATTGATVALALVHRSALSGAALEPEIVTSEGPARDGVRTRAAVADAARACIGSHVLVRGAVKAGTGTLVVEVLTAGEAILRVKRLTGTLAKKPASGCLTKKLEVVPDYDIDAKAAVTRFTVRMVAGRLLLPEAPERLAEAFAARLLALTLAGAVHGALGK